MRLAAIRTDRLKLEPLTAGHLPLLVELNSDPEVMRFVLGRAATPEETAAEWKQRLVRQCDPARGLGYWAGIEWAVASTTPGHLASLGVLTKLAMTRSWNERGRIDFRLHRSAGGHPAP